MNYKFMRGLLSASLLLMTVSGPIATLAADSVTGASYANAVEKIETSSISGQTLVKVTLREPLAIVPSSFTISAPPRVAFDLPDTENLSGGNSRQVSFSDLQSINIVQAGGRTRLVLNLVHPSRYDARLDGKVLYITLSGAASIATSVAMHEPVKAAIATTGSIGATEGNTVQNVDFRAESSDLAKFKIELSEPNPMVDVKRQGSSLVLVLQNVRLPDRLARRLDVRDFGTPVINAVTTAYGQNTQLVISNKGDWDYNVIQVDAAIDIEVRRVVVNPNSLVGAKELQGKTVSFNFTQPVPVSQMIGIFQDITGLNFMMMPGVTGEIERLKMENTPVETAIDVVSRMYGLSMRRFGSVVVVGKAADLAKYEKEAKDLQDARQDSEPIEQESIRVHYRPAAEIVAVLTGVAAATPQSSGTLASPQTTATAPGQPTPTPGNVPAAPGAAGTGKSLISSRGSISSDPVTNVIFVEETATQIQKIRDRVDSLDRPTRQVMIESRIVSVASTYAKALGAKIGFVTTNSEKVGSWGGKELHVGPLNFTSDKSVAASSQLSFSLFNSDQTRLLNLELTADENDGQSKSIAAPKILTQDGRPATITDGSTLYFQLSGGTNGPTTVSVDAATKLDVTPQIGADGKIQMKVYVNKGGIGPPTANNQPTVTKQEITTNVVVENGGTLMLGGVFTEDIGDNTDQVPFLGDIPFLGWLFKSNVKTRNRSELLIFLTPRIVTEELTLQ